MKFRIMRKFVARGTAALLGDSDYLLFALCLVLPMRRKGAVGKPASTRC